MEKTISGPALKHGINSLLTFTEVKKKNCLYFNFSVRNKLRCVYNGKLTKAMSMTTTEIFPMVQL